MDFKSVFNRLGIYFGLSVDVLLYTVGEEQYMVRVFYISVVVVLCMLWFVYVLILYKSLLL